MLKRIKWPTAAVVIAGIIGAVVVLVLAPDHVTEAISGSVGLMVGALFDRLIVKATPSSDGA